MRSSSAGALETIGGTPLHKRQAAAAANKQALQLSTLSTLSTRASTTTSSKVSALRRGTWDRLQDEETGGEPGITVHKSFHVVEASETGGAGGLTSAEDVYLPGS